MSSQKRFVAISVVGIIAVVAGLTYLGYRFFAGSGLADSRPWSTAEQGGGSLIEIPTGEIDLQAVHSVSVRGGWSVVIRSAMEPSLLVEVTERHADRVTVSRTRDILELEVADTTNYTDARFYAELSVPDLSAVEVVGLANVSFEGAANVDFSSSPSTNATVTVVGLANADILMNGGTLAGELEGLARVIYRGTVSSVTIDSEAGGFLRAVNVNQRPKEESE